MLIYVGPQGLGKGNLKDMSRQKKKRSARDHEQGAQPGSFANRPFAGLKKVEVVKEPPPPPPPEPQGPREESLDEAELLRRAMQGVAPLPNAPALVPLRAEARPMLAEQNEDLLVMKALDELVHGDTMFDFADTEEFIEAAVQGFDRNVLRRLRRGELAFQAHLDLHGMTRDKARQRVAEFIRDCHRTGKRCVLIIHGRGLGSKDNVPVLKIKLAAWLTRGAMGRKVLAYTSAQPHDGGTGAVYVLLRG